MDTNAVMSDTSKLTLDGREFDLPNIVGTEGERAVDITRLRSETGAITLDEGYRNTASCQSAITFINGEEGILRYRGIPIEQMAENSSFVETAYLLIYGELPTKDQLQTFSEAVREHSSVAPGLLKILNGFPHDASPMAMLSACINGLCGYHPEVLETDYREHFDASAAKLLGKVKTLAAAIYRHRLGKAPLDADPNAAYAQDFLGMMFKGTKSESNDPDVAQVLDTILLLHADHEQNCSASTVRMVGSSHANLFTSCAAGVCALWGPLHGGANVAIMNQLQQIHESDMDAQTFIAGVKEKKYLLFGFGHPVYRHYDPRARILKAAADKVLHKLGKDDPLLELAKRLEAAALEDEYFVSRKLYPNVDFYSGILMRAMGIPSNMFTVLFATGRMPGWIAQWKEVRDRDGRIYRPRQVYVGPNQRDYVPVDQRR